MNGMDRCMGWDNWIGHCDGTMDGVSEVDRPMRGKDGDGGGQLDRPMRWLDNSIGHCVYTRESLARCRTMRRAA